MSDIIHLLPDSIANQIAAGEVIQRPASIVKELLENAIDAGANRIQLIIKDAGRTLIQVIDNGKGMSPTDARLAFERHATSKIQSAGDLFNLHTMGFRGEALASIAAVAQIELRTKRAEDEVGTLIEISGSKVEKQECISCPEGSIFSVRNIFFNVPARRKFLKSNDTERRHIINELERIVLVYPDIEFSFIDNDIEVLTYPSGSLRQRIVSVEGKGLNQQLISIDVETSLAKITGFIGKPEFARKARALQFFFVNGRYMRHPFFNKAVTTAYESLIPEGVTPNYFIYFEVDPECIDVNIHPTKTEIKFENERPIWQILSATVKEALGKFNIVPTIDFDTADAVDIPIYDPTKKVQQPTIEVDPTYNPFKSNSAGNSYSRPKFDWEQLYHGFEKSGTDISSELSENSPADLFKSQDTGSSTASQELIVHYQYKNKYILTSVKSGLMLIDQHRAHVRILYDKYLNQIQLKKGISQRTLFPDMIELTPSEASMIPYLIDDFEAIGFDLGNLGNNTFTINGVPSDIGNMDAVELIHRIINNSIDKGCDVKSDLQEELALSLANSAAIPYGQKLTEEEMARIVDQLFASSMHKHTPDGKTIVSLMDDNNIDKMFK